MQFIPFLIVAIAAIADIIGCYAFNVQGWDELYFWSYANAMYILWYSFPFILGLAYYLLVEDLSEALFLAIGTLILFLFGLEDLFFYLFAPIVTKIVGIPPYPFTHNPFKAMPWLDWPKPMGIVQFLAGAEHNNLILLYFNVLIGIIVYYLFFFLMKKLEYKLTIDGFRIEI